MYCTKCGYQNPEESNFCASCGTPILGKEAYLSTDRTDEIAVGKVDSQEYSPRTTKVNVKAFTSGNIRAHLVSFSFAVMLIVDIIFIVFSAIEYELAGRILRDDYWTWDEVTASDNRIEAIETIWLILCIITIILFSVWIYRAYSNLSSFGCDNLKHSPRWSVGWFFIPIANLVKPYQVTQEIWKASDPETDINDGNAWQTSPSSPLIVSWWVLYIAAMFLGPLIINSLSNLDDVYHIRATSLVQLIFNVVEIVAIILAILVVQKINSRQEKKRQLILSST